MESIVNHLWKQQADKIEQLCQDAMVKHNCFQPHRFVIETIQGFPFDKITVRYKSDEDMLEESRMSAQL
jgi:hypothetical protein